MPPQRRHVAQPGSALSWGVRGRRFKSSRADQIQLPLVPVIDGNPTETRILTEFAGFLLPVICRDTPFTAGKFSYTLSYTVPYNYKSV